jgi:alkanesulfonate monooxygenase SsuD/methylene tetrahydromethanopterin reductase-like flavin-dependent oxidoreductase (luciferase family)
MSRSSNGVRFGINPRGLSFERIVSVAKAAEAAGFSTMAFSDRPPENNIEAWTLATAVATATQRIRVTHSTLNVPFRHPALLAKMAASLDVITGGGRVILTLGAGAQEEHATSYGIAFGTPGERVDGLIDAIHIMRGMWSNESFSYEGKRYSVREAAIEPKPVSNIAILIGAGKPRTLKTAGALADGWIKNGGWPATPEAYAELQEAVDRGAEGAGRDPAILRRVVNCTAYVGNRELAKVMPPTLGSGGGLMGTADQVLEIIEKHREAGVDTFHVQFKDDILDEQIPAFGEQIIAKLSWPGGPAPAGHGSCPRRGSRTQ